MNRARGSTAATFGSASSASRSPAVNSTGLMLRTTSGSRLAATSSSIASAIRAGIAKIPTLATARASVSTVKIVRALRRVSSPIDFRVAAVTTDPVRPPPRRGS